MGVSAEAASLSVEDLSTGLAEPQSRCRGRYDMAMARGFGVLLERIGHTDELGVVPCARQKLDIDRLPMIVESGRKNYGRNTVGCSWRVSPTEARASATSIVHASLAQ